MFRPLRPEEIDVRVGSVKDGSGGFLLLYKDARCDMKILDETVGIFGWQRHHELIDGQLFCTVSIYDDEKNMWISKQDVGIESNTEEVKGRASDAFKRACFNIGIGRELYTAPFIWISDSKASKVNWKFKKFRVGDIKYDDSKNIIGLSIEEEVNYKWQTVFTNMGRTKAKPKSKPSGSVDSVKEIKKDAGSISQEEAVEAMFDFAREKNIDLKHIKNYMTNLLGKTSSSELTMSEILELNQFIIDQSNYLQRKDNNGEI